MVNSNWLYMRKDVKSMLTKIVYLLFLVYMIYLIVHNDNLSVKIAYTVMMLFFGSFVILHEYLQLLYKKAIYYLVEACNPYTAMEFINKLRKFDILKSYKTSIDVFSTLALKDMGNSKELIIHLDTLEKKTFSTSFDLLLIYYRSYLEYYIEEKNAENVKSIYKKLMDLCFKEKRSTKYPTPFFKEEITAIYSISRGSYKAAEKKLRLVDPNYFNNREKCYYFFMLGKSAFFQGKLNAAQENLEKAIGLGGQISIVNESKKIIENIKRQGFETLERG